MIFKKIENHYIGYLKQTLLNNIFTKYKNIHTSLINTNNIKVLNINFNFLELLILYQYMQYTSQFKFLKINNHLIFTKNAKVILNYLLHFNYISKQNYHFLKKWSFFKSDDVIFKQLLKFRLKKKYGKFFKMLKFPRKLRKFFKKVRKNKYTSVFIKKRVFFKKNKNLLVFLFLKSMNNYKFFFKKSKKTKFAFILPMVNFYKILKHFKKKNQNNQVFFYKKYSLINIWLIANYFTNLWRKFFKKKKSLVKTNFTPNFYKNTHIHHTFYFKKVFFKKSLTKLFFDINILFINVSIKSKSPFKLKKSKSKKRQIKLFLLHYFFKYFALKKIQPVNYFNMSSFFFYNSIYKNLFEKTNNSALVYFNNKIPLNLLPAILKKKIFTKFQKNYIPLFFKYIYYYVVNFLEFFIKKKILFKLKTKNKIPLSVNDSLLNIFKKHKQFQSRVGRGFFLMEMLEILWLTFFYKDLELLMDWCIKTMQRISFKSHKKFLLILKIILTGYSDIFFDGKDCGFFFDIRGKVGVSGNAKKRNFSFYTGKYSKTTKNSKFDYNYNIVRTSTGALGVTMILFF